MKFAFKLDEGSPQTKLQQLIHAVSEAINLGILKEGDFLPSVNQLSKEGGISRDTIFKAYSILKQRSIISSTPTKGYFVSSESYRVFVLLDDFSAFKEQLYKSFRSNLPDNYSVDLLFHHYNPEIFNQLILNSLGRYSMYIVMNIDNKNMEEVVRKIDPKKLLLLDMGSDPKNEISFLVQDFNQAVYDCLESGIKLIQKYQEFILVFPHDTPHPNETIDAFKRFCSDHQLKHTVLDNIDSREVQPGQAYLVIKDSDLVKIVKDCKKNGYKIGSEVGIISYNDTPMKEIVGAGITVISTDFVRMGRDCANFIVTKEKLTEVIPTKLILRGSL
ncbi:MAG TPA: GntR family transcriptional regulator [Prolixibacteraceae bacterium]|jgi:DNA-binding transcriptional regulator YhcF (GntR family)|nr:GntR family transcriptional regulator [Prolixibacteraceae bacterium]